MSEEEPKVIITLSEYNELKSYKDEPYKYQAQMTIGGTYRWIGSKVELDNKLLAENKKLNKKYDDVFKQNNDLLSKIIAIKKKWWYRLLGEI